MEPLFLPLNLGWLCGRDDVPGLCLRLKRPGSFHLGPSPYVKQFRLDYWIMRDLYGERPGRPLALLATAAEVPGTEVKPSRALQFQLKSQLIQPHMWPQPIPCGQKNQPTEPIHNYKKSQIIVLSPLHFKVVCKIQHSHIYSVHINYFGTLKILQEKTQGNRLGD